MENYVGFGFSVYDVKAEDWLELLKNFDPDAYKSFEDDTKEANPGYADVTPVLLEEVEEYISMILMSGEGLDGYLAAVINEGEAEAAGTDSLVTACDGFVLFESIRFLGDNEARAKYIANESDFVKVVSKYITTDGITFGNIYDGYWSDSADCHMG
jgi:hypothetical protein